MDDLDTRTRILHVAGKVFAEKGFEHATIREIVREANANLASVNYHFGDKERLFVEAVKYAHQYRDQLAPLPIWSPSTPPEQKLRDFIEVMVRRVLVIPGMPWQHQLMMRVTVERPDTVRDIVESFIRPNNSQLLSIIDELVPPDTPPHRRQLFAFSVVGQCFFHHIARPIVTLLVDQEERERHFTPEQIADHIAEVCLAALGRQSLFENRSS